MPGMSGILEHIVEMSYTINHSRKQRMVTITLIDLKNAFREVHHSLIQSVLCYHCIPDEINCIVKIFYGDFCISQFVRGLQPPPPPPLSFLRHPPLDPACPPFLKSLCPLPSFLFHLLLRSFRQSPPTLTQMPPALIQPTNQPFLV